MKNNTFCINNKEEIDKANRFIQDCLENKVYPIIKGVPFCCIDIKHCYDLFFGKGRGEKPESCKTCKLIRFCNYNKENFELKPIKYAEEELLRFLEERDENITDWF